MPDKHSVYSPSRASCWAVCTGSVKLCEGYPDEQSKAAAEGTAAAKLLELSLLRRKHPESFKGKTVEGFLVDATMIDNVGDAFDYILALSDKIHGHIYTEIWLDIDIIKGGGTADVVIVGNDELHVLDLKYGAGVPVEVTGNYQLQLYMIGSIAKFITNNKSIKHTHRFVNHILQPRCPHPDGPFRTEELTMKDLQQFSEEIAAAVEEIESGSTELVPGEKQCRWCKARAECPALARRVVEGARIDFNDFIDKKKHPVPCPIQLLTIDELATALTRINLLKDWVKAVESRVMTFAMEGKPIPGFKLVEGKSNRRWVDEGAVIQAFTKLKLDEDSYMPRSLVGIGAGEKLIPKDKRESFMKKYTVKPEGALVIAPDTDPRPARSISTAAEDFSDLIPPKEV